jgi:hypothetical protein
MSSDKPGAERAVLPLPLLQGTPPVCTESPIRAC